MFWGVLNSVLIGTLAYLTGLLTGCGQKWGIVRHYEGQLCGKKYQLHGKLYGSQLLISNAFEGGGAKWCFDWYRCILVYFSDGIDTIS